MCLASASGPRDQQHQSSRNVSSVRRRAQERRLRYKRHRTTSHREGWVCSLLDNRLGAGVDADTSSLCVFQLWPGPTAFPDFTSPETRQWWEDCIREFHAKVPVDGLWIVSVHKRDDKLTDSAETNHCPDTIVSLMLEVSIIFLIVKSGRN